VKVVCDKNAPKILPWDQRDSGIPGLNIHAMSMIISMPKNPFIQKYSNEHQWFMDIAQIHGCSLYIFNKWIFGMDIAWKRQPEI